MSEQTAVERAAEFIAAYEVCDWGPGECGACKGLAQALVDAGVIPDGDSEARVEYGVRHRNGNVLYGDQEWVRTQALKDMGDNADGIVQRTVTTHVSEWTEVSGDE